MVLLTPGEVGKIVTTGPVSGALSYGKFLSNSYA